MRAVILASRMRSWRFPGKMLVPWGVHKSLLGAVLVAAGDIKADAWMIATDEETEPFIRTADVLSPRWQVFVGEPTNVLKRYVDCAQSIGATEIVRVCGDAPFLNSTLINMVCDHHDPKHYDSTYSADKFPGLISGVFNTDALVRLMNSNPTEEECIHVTIGINEARGFRVNPVHLNLTIDTLADYKDLIRYA